MKLFIKIFTAFIFMSTVGYIYTASASFSKNPHQLKELSSAWKNYKSIQPKSYKDDVMMGYAGKDILSDSPILNEHPIAL